jgi:hypothetical protein
MARLNTIAQLALALVVTISLGSCLFTPRDPGNPDDFDPVPWISPDEPEKVLENIAVTFSWNRMTNYGRSFSDETIEMTFDLEDQPYGDPTEFDDWTAELEEQRMRGIIPEDVSNIELTWDLSSAELIEDTDTEWHYEDLVYKLVFEKDGLDVVYEGEIYLWFIDDGGLWYISKWWDEKKTGSENNSWGYLRLKNVIEWPQ